MKEENNLAIIQKFIDGLIEDISILNGKLTTIYSKIKILEDDFIGTGVLEAIENLRKLLSIYYKNLENTRYQI